MYEHTKGVQMNKLEQAARQALSALQEYQDTQMIKAPRRAITALKNALQELEDDDKRKSEQSV